MHVWCYFLFRVKRGDRYDVRLPDGGVVVQAADELDAVKKAYVAAYVIIQPKDDELVVCHPVRDECRRHQAWLMHKDWMRCHAYIWN
jgi:hypothetical protein